MITRDISIKDAILDLIDNSIDGANNINPTDYSGLFIKISIDECGFSITDNCGGFSIEVAKQYAFRFGRPDDAPKTGGSIGRFGVGMKRALFKIGQHFTIESKTINDHFKVDVDVDNWKSKKKKIKNENDSIIEVDDWSFNYTEVDSTNSNLSENGTFINVGVLNGEVAKIFNDDIFLIELARDIERLLNFSIEKGIKIFLNGKELQKKGIFLLNDTTKPYLHDFQYNGVNVRIVAGLSFVGEPRSSGWYIYCNDRLVIEAEQSSITGWDTSNIPKWHPDYVMFKGVVFMNSNETFNLPLTTTKKGIDTTSIIYSKALVFMKEAMTYVIGFLKDVRKLGNLANEYRELLGEQEDTVSVHELKYLPNSIDRNFVPPKLDYENISSKNNSVRISFSVSKHSADDAKEHAGVKSLKELGEYIFEYYLKMEDLKNE